MTEEDDVGFGPLDAFPGMARIAAGAWVQGAAWGIGTSIRAGRRLAEAAISGESAGQLLSEVRDEALLNVKRVLDVADRDSRTQGFTDAVSSRIPDEESRKRQRADSLRERGARLFERAAEIDQEEDAIHPGFDRIVDQLAPDEARILKLLVNEGPQAIVYINRAAPLGFGAREVARRLTLLGREAGCMHPELVPAYLDNLVRLGLVAIRRDPVDNESAYQVLEAQPEVVDAMKSVNSGIFRGQATRRSVHITDFGKSFCQVCFPAEHLTGEFGVIEIEEIDEMAHMVAADRDLDGADSSDDV
jgi:hypothetical protein